MIKPVIFVKILAYETKNGGFATKLSPAWQVSVSNGEKEFYPKASAGYNDGDPFWSKERAVELAKHVADIMGGAPIMLYERLYGSAEHNFVEDIV